jgi:hypothetical protein
MFKNKKEKKERLIQNNNEKTPLIQNELKFFGDSPKKSRKSKNSTKENHNIQLVHLDEVELDTITRGNESSDFIGKFSLLIDILKFELPTIPVIISSCKSKKIEKKAKNEFKNLKNVFDEYFADCLHLNEFLSLHLVNDTINLQANISEFLSNTGDIDYRSEVLQNNLLETIVNHITKEYPLYQFFLVLNDLYKLNAKDLCTDNIRQYLNDLEADFPQLSQKIELLTKLAGYDILHSAINLGFGMNV